MAPNRLTPGHFERDNFHIHTLGPEGCDRVPPAWQPRNIEGPVDACVATYPCPSARSPQAPPLVSFLHHQGQDSMAAVALVLALVLLFFFFPQTK